MMKTSHEKTFSQFESLLKSADSLIITAGAGMGVDSGLPDFRGNAGMWQAYPELGRQRMDFTSIANPKAFVDNPHLAWGFYGHRLNLYRHTIPHEGFTQLLDIANKLHLPYFVFTSNVDGQFVKAGFDDRCVYECHGSIHHLQCTTPCCDVIWTADSLNPVIDNEHCEWLGELPTCPHCGRLARPNILMFGDWAWRSERTDEQALRLRDFLMTYPNPIVIEIGAGIAIPTVRRFSEQFAPRLIRINPRDGNIPKGGIFLETTALSGIREIWQMLN